MSREIAEHIYLMRVKRGYSHRLLSEKVVDIYPELFQEIYGQEELKFRGMQWHGEGLCKEAAETLGVTSDQYQDEWA